MRRVAIVVAGSICVGLVGVLAANKPSTGDTTKVLAEPKVAIPVHNTLTRGSYRSGWFSANMVDGVGKSYVITTENEMDVTALTFLSQATPAGATIRGSVYLQCTQALGGAVYPLNLATTEPGTIHLTFDPPVPVRAGDTLYFTPGIATGSPTSAGWEVTLNGTVPGVAKTNAVVTY